MAVTQSSCDGIAIRYVLWVLWMTSCFYIVGPTGGWIGMEFCTSSPVAAGGVQATVGRPAHLLTSSLAAQVATNM